MTTISLTTTAAPANGSSSSSYTSTEVVVLGCLAGLTSLLTVGGNGVVLLSFLLERSLRQPTNYFIASLAVSDLIIGCVSMPFYTVYLLAGQHWPLGEVLCDLWLSVDYTVCLCSIYTVLCITVDRFCSVRIPTRYRTWRTEAKVKVAIGVVWVVPAAVFFTTIFGWQHMVGGGRTVPPGKCYVQYMQWEVFNAALQIGYFWVTLVVMCSLYVAIYRSALQLQNRSSVKRRRSRTALEEGAAPGGQVTAAAPTAGTHHINEAEILSQGDLNSRKSTAAIIDEEDGFHPGDRKRNSVSSDFSSPTSLFARVPEAPACQSPGRREHLDTGAPAIAVTVTIETTSDENSVFVVDGNRNKALDDDVTERTSNTAHDDVTHMAGISQRSDHREQEEEDDDVTENEKSDRRTLGQLNEREKEEGEKEEEEEEEEESNDPVDLSPPQMSSLAVWVSRESRISTDDDKNGEIDDSDNKTTERRSTGGQRSRSRSSKNEASKGDCDGSDWKRLNETLFNSASLWFRHLRCNVDAALDRKRKRRRSRGSCRGEGRAKKALRTITLILGAFVFCWTPWHILSLAIGFCPMHCVPSVLYDVSYWLCYLNSPINPFCYAFANRQFKKTFVRIVKMDWRRV